jgi:chorismate mutase
MEPMLANLDQPTSFDDATGSVPSSTTSEESGDDSGLADWRAEIDTLDTQLLELLMRRQQVVRAIGDYKRVRGLTPLDPKRWRQLLDANMAKGESVGLCREFVSDLYHLIHDYSLRLESESGETEEEKA